MKITTSRYGAHQLILDSGLAPVRISVGHPRWKLRYELAGKCPLLYPTRDMLKLPIEPYQVRYKAILEAAGVDRVRAELEAIARAAGAPGVVLLCFEDLAVEGQWCHRRMLADHWLEKTGEAVPELTAEADDGLGATGRRGRPRPGTDAGGPPQTRSLAAKQLTLF